MGVSYTPEFLNSLKNGVLSPITKRVKKDSTLDIELRENEIEVYYRGAQLFRVNCDEFKRTDNELVKGIDYPPKEVNAANVKKWVEIIPVIKDCLDRNKNTGPQGPEHEAQQIIVRENNLLRGKSQNTDYYITDFEREMGKGQPRFDLIAVKLPKNRVGRKTPPKVFAIIELKYGVDAIFGSKKKDEKESVASLEDHFRDMKWLIENNKLIEIANITKTQYKFKFELNLFDKSNSIKQIEDANHSWEKPEYIIILANFDPHYLNKKTKRDRDLIGYLAKIHDDYKETVFEKMNVRFATACGVGYALYDGCIKDYNEFIEYLKEFE